MYLILINVFIKVVVTCNDLETLGIFDSIPQYSTECLDMAITRFLPILGQTQISYQQKRIIRSRIADLQQLQQVVNPYPLHKIQPITVWCQNNQFVYFSFKLSHRWDSPPCQDIRSTILKFNNFSQNIYIQIVCVMSQNKYIYELSMQLSNQVQQVKIQKEGFMWVGKVGKAKQQLWRYLDKSNRKYSIWTQMARKNKVYMDRWQQLLQQEQSQKPKKKKKYRPPKIQSNQTQSQVIEQREDRQPPNQNL